MTHSPVLPFNRSSLNGNGRTEFPAPAMSPVSPYKVERRYGMMHALLLLIALFLSAPAMAQMQPNSIHGELLAEQGEVAPGGGDTLALAFRPDPGWHGYWSNPGDAGFGIDLKWALPPGVTLGEPQFPVPQTLVIAGLMNHVYEGPHALLFDLKLDRSIAAGTRLPIALDAQWLACTDEICVPESGHFEIDLVAGAAGRAATARFDRFRSKLPTPLDRTGTFNAANGLLRLAIPFPAAAALADPHFFAGADGMVDYAAPQKFMRSGDTLIMETRLAGDPPSDVSGLLALGDGGGLRIAAVPGSVPAGGTRLGEPVDAAGDAPTLLVSFGAALLGGLLLNILPCVFPILGLKAVSLSRAAIGESAARRDALAYAAGAILACLALGGVLLLLRAQGEAVGWAFQLQEPAVVIALFLLTVAIVVNLLGLFDVPGLAAGDRLTRSGGMGGSFWTGALAAFVATPCTGPFMAAALGAALLLPVPAALLLFAGLGIGLALPFLAIGFVPALRHWLPRPGAWMESFRKWMALPMALTALALAWLLWRLGGPALLLAGGIAALAMAAPLLLLGRMQKRGGKMIMPVAFAALAMLLLPPAVIAAGPGDRFVPAVSDSSDAIAFSEPELAKLRADGKPVFLYFTADWCVTCKANEAAAIDRDAVRDAFGRAGIVTMRGDFTRRDPAIARFLAEHGRAGIPFYLYYPAGGEPPRELPQLLSQDRLIALAEG